VAERIRITAGSVALKAELSDSPTARAILEVLPIRAVAQTWGDEIYFPIPVKQNLDATAAELVEVGVLGYWPTGQAFCIFFGPTPTSRGDEIRPASAVNLVGKVLGDARRLKSVQQGDAVLLEAD
jgi:uncharacterized protein